MFQVIDTYPITKARVIEVIEITAFAGAGTEAEPTQLVTYYFDRDGKWLATRNLPIKLEEEAE